MAVGSNRGVQRNDVIATTHPDKNIATMALSPGRVQSFTGAKTAETTPASANGTAPVPAKDESNLGSAPKSSITSAEPLPFRDNRTGAVDKMSDVREGTSTTRYVQQANTHAHGNVSDGTPAVARDGQGEKQSIMEPSTVGQAPKEHPIPDTSEQPTIIEQAQHSAEAALQQATAAGQSVLAAVGLGGKKVEEPVKETKHDPAIDAMEGKNVEEFLRAQNQSTAKQAT